MLYGLKALLLSPPMVHYRPMNLSPVAVIQEAALYRTPLYMEGGNFRVWVGDGMIRYMTKEELPDEIAKKLAMVIAYDDGKNIPSYFKGDVRLSLGTAFGTTQFYIMPDWYDKNYFDIGWRINENYFCIVITKLIIVSLRGEVLNGNT